MLKVVDWNINGGFLVKNNKTEKNFQFFIDKIRKLNPDILLIQEGHISKDLNQAELLSRELNLKFYCTQKLGESHIEKGNQLCLFILSKFELKNVDFFQFSDPNVTLWSEKFNRELKSDFHIKGFLSAEIEVNSTKVNIASGHGHALHIFDKNLDEYPFLIKEIENYLIKKSTTKNMIVGADLNYENAAFGLKEVFQNDIKLLFQNEITYKKGQSDYVFLKKETNIIEYKIDKCSQDHALISFKIELIK